MIYMWPVGKLISTLFQAFPVISFNLLYFLSTWICKFVKSVCVCVCVFFLLCESNCNFEMAHLLTYISQ